MNPTLWVVALFMLVADIIALCWVAMWVGLTAKNPNRITSLVVVRVLVAPCVVYAAVLALASGIDAIGHFSFPPPGWKILVGLWFGLGMLADLVFGFMAWRQVTTRFRELATNSAPGANAPGGKATGEERKPEKLSVEESARLQRAIIELQATH